MYTKCTERSVKEAIVRLFCNPSGVMRIVIASRFWNGFGLSRCSSDYSVGFTNRTRWKRWTT